MVKNLSEFVSFSSRCRKSDHKDLWRLLHAFEGRYVPWRVGLWSTLLAGPGPGFQLLQYQTLGLKGFRADAVTLQIQVRQTGVLFQDLRQGLTWRQMNAEHEVSGSQTPSNHRRFMTGGSLMIHDASWCTILIRSSFGFELLTLITKLSLKIFIQCDVNDSLATWEINKTSLCIFCMKFLSSFHWLHFQMNACILILDMPFF